MDSILTHDMHSEVKLKMVNINQAYLCISSTTAIVAAASARLNHILRTGRKQNKTTNCPKKQQITAAVYSAP